MSGFAALMKLSASQTQEAQSAVQSALEQRQIMEAKRRKLQEDRERKERELENRLRLKHFEDQKKALEQQKRQEQERAARELALQRREEEMRDSLRYGPKKAKSGGSTPSSDAGSKWPSASSSYREEVRKQRFPSEEEDDSGAGLTRQEKRERKLQAELRRSFDSPKRSSHISGSSKAGRRLPGGALDIVTDSTWADPSLSSKSVKARISATPNTLTRLNEVKRDTRTIDEILQDRAKAREGKILDGEEARDFNDWFGSSKKKELAKKLPTPTTSSAPVSRADTPSAQPSTSTTAASSEFKQLSSSASQSSHSSATNGFRHSSQPTSAVKHTPNKARARSVEKHASSLSKPPISSKAASATVKSNFVKTSASASLRAQITSNARPITKKRPRSSSLSDSPPPQPSKRQAPSPGVNDISNEIWKLFGKDRTSYMKQDVFSDDEDMEADARVLEKEEKLSSRIAQKEEQEALEAERRHEEEKRKRKMREKRV